MTGRPLLEARGLHKQFGGVLATDALDFSVEAGEIHAVIGPNGAGKTTFMAELSGLVAVDGGTIHLDGEDITRLPIAARARRGIARSFQITSVLRDFTCLDNVSLAVQARLGHSFRFWRPASAEPELQAPARSILADLGLCERADDLAGSLAHGEQRQLEIGMAIASEPRLLLLDEPMAGMSSADSDRMTDYLASLKGRFTMVLVEHDMDAVFALADRITVLVYGRAIATGTPDAIRGDPAVREAYLGED